MTTAELSQNKCEACTGSTPKLTSGQIKDLLVQVNGWQIIDNRLHKEWHFKNFAEPLNFVDAIGELAEQEGHHPNINFGWGYVEVTVWTHVIDGLSKNDFILAAKIDALNL